MLFRSRTLKKMGVVNAVERANQFGKLPKEKIKKTKNGKKVLKQRLVEKEPIDETQKQKMLKMVEDILAKKSKNNSDVVSKEESSVSKILIKNLKSIKKISYKMPNSDYYLVDLNAYKKAVYCSEPTTPNGCV